MKKVILTLGACVAVLTAMAQSPSYRVTGTAEGAADGDTVKMCYYKGWSVVPVAETVVKDGQFTFEGRQDTAVFQDGGRRLVQLGNHPGERRHQGASVGRPRADRGRRYTVQRFLV